MARPMIALSLAALVLLAAGCKVEDTNTSEGTPPPGDLFVEVLLDEYTIELPDSAPAGTISFEISNTGDEDHSFAIEGPGVSEALDDELEPIETEVLTLELEPGTYTVWCPIADHRERGMEATIEITEPTSQSEGADVYEGVGPSEKQAPIEEDDDDYTP